MYNIEDLDIENGYADTIILLEDNKPEDYLGIFSALGAKVNYDYHIINAVAAKIPVEKLEEIEKYNFVRKIENNGRVYALGLEDGDTPDDEPVEYYQWNLDNVKAQSAWELGFTGKGVKVAVIDTGIYYKHPDLANNYKGGYNFVDKTDDPLDDNGHGTHCAGIIAANGKIKGVAPDAELYGVKVLNSWGSGTYADVIAGIEWAVDNNMDVASMSLGGSAGSEALKEACDAAMAHGTVIVAAAGNSGGSIVYPAKYDSTITVGAVDKNNNIAYFSSRGPEMDVVAPGVDVYSTYFDSYETLSGTSMATPHVSGAVAIIKQKFPGLGFEDVREILHTTSTDLGEPGFDELYGYGIIDLEAIANK